MSTSFGLGAAVVAGLVAGAAPSGENPSVQPIQLDVVDSGDRLLLKVVGSSDTPVEAGFHLAVTSEGAGGTNRTNQSGHARLEPGKVVTMVTISVANGPASKWRATLDVEGHGGLRYTVTRGSDG